MHESNKQICLHDEHYTEITPTIRRTEALDGSYHQVMVRRTGATFKWGETEVKDPTHNPWGPEIADIEISTICNGIPDTSGVTAPCSFCYKSCSGRGTYMSFETFKAIFDRLNKQHTLTQIAFGSDATATANPDMWKMFEYCRSHAVTPNITVADVTDEVAAKLVKHCGAVAVSWYPLRNKEVCYDSVRRLVDAAFGAGRSMQINIHALLAEETLPHFDELIEDCIGDPRLRGLNAVVLLSLKQKGRGVCFNKVAQRDFNRLLDNLTLNKIRYGMDSCSANKFLKYAESVGKLDLFKQFIAPCESTLFSSYINVEGKFFPCSFMEGEGEWAEGIDVCSYEDFKEVWLHPKTQAWRDQYLNQIEKGGCTHCPYYDI